MIAPPEVLGYIAAWGWSDGLIPSAAAPVRRMDSFRDDFIRAFTSLEQIAGVRE